MINDLYIFFDSSRPNEISRPHYYRWHDVLGIKVYYTYEDILKTRELVSKTTFNRLMKLKPGTHLRLHHLHSVGDMMIRMLTDEEKLVIQGDIDIRNSISETNAEIKKACPQLFDKLSDLQKQQRKLIKQAMKMNIKL